MRSCAAKKSRYSAPSGSAASAIERHLQVIATGRCSRRRRSSGPRPRSRSTLPRPPSARRSAASSACERRPDLRPGRRLASGAEGGRHLVLDRRGQQAGGRQHARMARHEDARRCRARRPARRHAAAPPPPSGSSVKRRGSMPLPDRHEADAFGHLRVEDAVDAERRLLDREAERAGDRRARSPSRASSGFSLQRAAGEIVGVEIAEHDRGVGDGRLRRRRGRSRPGPAPSRPIAGRRAGRPPASSQAMLPPPEPIELTSTIGTRTG